jgi:hypothetical protein
MNKIQLLIWHSLAVMCVALSANSAFAQTGPTSLGIEIAGRHRLSDPIQKERTSTSHAIAMSRQWRFKPVSHLKSRTKKELAPN